MCALSTTTHGISLADVLHVFLSVVLVLCPCDYRNFFDRRAYTTTRYGQLARPYPAHNTMDVSSNNHHHFDHGLFGGTRYHAVVLEYGVFRRKGVVCGRCRRIRAKKVMYEAVPGSSSKSRSRQRRPLDDRT